MHSWASQSVQVFFSPCWWWVRMRREGVMMMMMRRGCGFGGGGGKVHPSVWAEDVLWNSNKFPRFFCCTHELRQHCSRFGVDNSLLLPDQVAKWASQLGGNEFAAGASLTRFDKRNAFTGFQTEGKWFATCNSQTKSRMGSIMKRKGRNTLLNFTQNLLIQSRCTAQAHTKTYKSTLVPVA